MQIFKKQTAIDFMYKRQVALIGSLVLLIISIGSIATRGLNLGVDFTGGTLVEVGYQSAVAPAEIRQVLKQADFADVTAQSFGTARDVLIRLAIRIDDNMSVGVR